MEFITSSNESHGFMIYNCESYRIVNMVEMQLEYIMIYICEIEEFVHSTIDVLAGSNIMYMIHEYIPGFSILCTFFTPALFVQHYFQMTYGIVLKIISFTH